MEQSIATARWSLPHLIAFRFFFVYFVLYVFPFPLGLVSFFSVFLQPLFDLSVATYTAFAKNFMNLEIHPPTNGSGDTTFHYVQVLQLATYSFLIMIGWSRLDRKRSNYEKLLYYLIILLRYYLACTMVGYGFIKIFKTQFPFPTLERLLQTYGESSPMGLLWTFMGYSTPYNVFTGLVEATGGILLFFRRTRILGALIVMGVMSNVVMLNFAYDVPVKLFSLHLLAMAVLIITPDAKRLLNFFFFNKTADPEQTKTIYANAKMKWLYFIGKGLFITYVLTTTIHYAWNGREELTELEKKAKQPEFFQGEFQVESFSLNGETIRPGQMDTRSWKKVTMAEGKLIIQHMDGGSIPWIFHKSNSARRIILLSPDLSTTGDFRFLSNGARLTMEGKLNEDILKIDMKKISEAQTFRLVERGFHWVNESPFNR